MEFFCANVYHAFVFSAIFKFADLGMVKNPGRRLQHAVGN